MTKLVRPQKISDQILSILEERIATGVYEEGGKIPPERTLAEEFGVSRPSVRVALNILIARQVLEARQGDGYYVSVKPQQDFLQSWQELLGKHTNWETDVFDFSCHIEGCMASLAAERRTDADLKRIDFWRQKFESACESGQSGTSKRSRRKLSPNHRRCRTQHPLQPPLRRPAQNALPPDA